MWDWESRKGTFSSTGEKAPRYRLSPNYFQKLKRMPAPDWATKNVLYYRVLKCDVIKMKFLKLWDLSGYSERTMSKRPTYQK